MGKLTPVLCPTFRRSARIVCVLAIGIFHVDIPAIAQEVSASTTPSAEHLLFDEEFTGATKDFLSSNNTDFPRTSATAGKWNIFHYAVDPNDPKNPQNYFLMKNAITISGGALYITANNVPYTAWATTHPHEFSYTSGRIESTNYFTHGFFEIRAKLPSGAGFWPGVWLFAKSPLAEIDIVEGHGAAPIYASNIYYWRDKPKTGVSVFPDPTHNTTLIANVLRGNWSSQTNARRRYAIPFRFHDAPSSLADAYHIYAADWQADGITFYFDGQPYLHVTRSLTDPMRLILSFALGGPGDNITNSTPFPATFDVDYVRVYDRGPVTSSTMKPPTLALGVSKQDTYALPELRLEN